MHAQVQIVRIIWTFHICDGEQWGQAPGDQAAADPIAAREQFLLNISPSAYLRRTVSVGCLQIYKVWLLVMGGGAIIDRKEPIKYWL